MLRRMSIGIAVMIVPLAGSACASDAKYNAEPVPVRRMTPDHLLGRRKETRCSRPAPQTPVAHVAGLDVHLRFCGRGSVVLRLKSVDETVNIGHGDSQRRMTFWPQERGNRGTEMHTDSRAAVGPERKPVIDP